MTPREAFRFAAKMRTSMKDHDIRIKVDHMIDRLNLRTCCNSRIGGVRMKGISGGERKRTSIGYELITDPCLIILDEPTSGLDSNTAF